MHKNIVVFEVEGGSDKYIDGHRRDTMPIVEAIRARGWGAEVVYYRPEWTEALYAYVSGNFDGYVSRVNPGNIPAARRATSTCCRACPGRPAWSACPRRRR